MTEEEIMTLSDGFSGCQWEVGYSTGNMVETLFLKGLAVVDEVDISGVKLNTGRKFLRGLAMRGMRNSETGQIQMTIVVPVFIAIDNVVMLAPVPDMPAIIPASAEQTQKIIGA